jgi:predicted PurR-regulated permease PerM
MEKDNTKTKGKMKTRDWKWIVSVLIAIIISLFTAIFLNTLEKISISDVISIGSGLVSIALAIVAIIMAVAEGIKSSNKEEKVQLGLDKIITNTDTMRDLIHRLEKEVLNTHTEVKSFRKEYIESAKPLECQMKTYRSSKVHKIKKLLNPL